MQTFNTCNQSLDIHLTLAELRTRYGDEHPVFTRSNFMQLDYWSWVQFKILQKYTLPEEVYVEVPARVFKIMELSNQTQIEMTRDEILDGKVTVQGNLQDIAYYLASTLPKDEHLTVNIRALG